MVSEKSQPDVTYMELPNNVTAGVKNKTNGMWLNTLLF